MEDSKPALWGLELVHLFPLHFSLLKEGKNNKHPQKAKPQDRTLTQNPAEEMKPQEHVAHQLISRVCHIHSKPRKFTGALYHSPECIELFFSCYRHTCFNVVLTISLFSLWFLLPVIHTFFSLLCSWLDPGASQWSNLSSQNVYNVGKVKQNEFIFTRTRNSPYFHKDL